MAVMWDVIINNNSGSIVTVEDLGIELSNGDTVNFSSQFDFEEIAGSDDLRALVSSADLRVQDPFDLPNYCTPANGVLFLRLDHLYNLKKNHYTIDDLETANSGVAIDWTNITNAPSFGSVQWGSPIIARVTAIGSGKPAAPAVDDMCVDTDDSPDKLYKYDGTSWVDFGIIPNGGRVIDLSSATENIKSFATTGEAWTDTGEAADNTAVMVNDDGDGNPAQYIYETTADEWMKIADVDFASHFDGGDSKHDASEIDVEGTYTNIPGTPDDLETALSAIDTKLGTISSSVDNTTLDGAYDKGGAGAGRLINATDGTVKIDRGAATSGSFEIVPKSNLPTTGLSDGQIDIKDGILCIYDATRSKWLSVQRQFIVFGRKGTTKNQYLGFFGSRLVSNSSGLRLARAATIVSIAGQIDVAGTCTFNIRRNDVATNVDSLTVSAAVGNEDISKNTDLNGGDYIQCQLGATVAVEDPMVVIEIAWRL
jgi:hypothetical protein